MKNNNLARLVVRVRLVASFLAVVVILAAEIGLGGSMVCRLGHTSTTRTPTQTQSVKVNIGDLFTKTN